MTPSTDPQTRTALALVVGGSAALLLLAAVPSAFSAGYVLRGFLLAVAAAAALVGFGLQRAGPLPARGVAWAVALLPAGIPLLGLMSAGREDLWSWLRNAAPWFALAALPLVWGRALLDDTGRARAWQLAGAAGVGAALWTAIDAWQRGAAGAGPFGRPGVAGPVLAALAWPSAMALGRGLWMRATLAAAFVGATIATRSRTALIAFAVASVAWFVWTRAPARRSRWARVAAAGLAVCFLYGALGVAGRVPLPGSRHTVDVRLGLHRASFALMQEAPLRGHGLGRYGEEILRVRDLQEAQLESGRRPTHAHDDYVHVAAEVGLLGGVLLLFFVVGVLALSLRAVRGRQREPGHDLRVACWAGLVTLGISAFGDGVLTDPAGVVVFSLCAATLWGSVARPAMPAVAQVRLRQVAWLAAPLLIACAFAQGRDLAADAAFRDYLTAAGPALRRGGVTSLDTLAQEQLVEGALQHRPDDARAWYQLGVHRARKGEYVSAREAFRQSIRHDASMTEARLDLASVYERQERYDDARDVLLEARRWDPTRFDVALRLGHVALGPEPLAGDPLPEVDIEALLRRYNVARSLDPSRIENTIAEARIARRMGRHDEAGVLLRQVMRKLNVTLDRAPPEILLESFRLAEAQRAVQTAQVTILLLALRADPRLAGLVRKEAMRWTDLGEAREAEANPELRPGVARLDDRTSQRAYDAAAVRFTGLLFAGQADPNALLRTAQSEANERRNRRALARYRALLAWSNPDTEADADLDDERRMKALARRGDLFIEAAKVAKPVDGDRARLFFDRGHALIGAEMLAKGEWKQAARLLRSVLQTNPEAAEARLARAHALVRDGKRDEAEQELVRALADKPALRAEAHRTMAFKVLYDRTAVRDAMGLHDD